MPVPVGLKRMAAYARLRERPSRPRADELDFWSAFQERFSAEWDLFKAKLAVIAAAASNGYKPEHTEHA